VSNSKSSNNIKNCTPPENCPLNQCYINEVFERTLFRRNTKACISFLIDGANAELEVLNILVP